MSKKRYNSNLDLPFNLDKKINKKGKYSYFLTPKEENVELSEEGLLLLNNEPKNYELYTFTDNESEEKINLDNSLSRYKTRGKNKKGGSDFEIEKDRWEKMRKKLSIRNKKKRESEYRKTIIEREQSRKKRLSPIPESEEKTGGKNRKTKRKTRKVRKIK